VADFAPAHPGEVLSEDFLKPLHLSQYALAKAIGAPQIRISEIVNGKRAITPGTTRIPSRYGENVGVIANFSAGAEGEELETNILHVGYRNPAQVLQRRGSSCAP
jgi:antitoxin HigA-1